MIILFFGQPCSGKTTLAKSLYDTLNVSPNLIHIDGDEFRKITGNVGYDRKSRLDNVKSAFDMALFLKAKGRTVILSFVTPYIESRLYLRDKFPDTKFIYLEYNHIKNVRGREKYHVADFESPCFDELQNDNFSVLNTSKLSEYQCIKRIMF
jgi:adenylylsulfate kinase-like enzyme